MAGRSSLIRVVAFITLASGVANIYWAMNPATPARRLLHEVLPLEFMRFPRSFTLLIGFALVISAINVYKRKRRAYHLVLATLGALRHRAHAERARLRAIAAFALRDRPVVDGAPRLHGQERPPDWRWAAVRLAVAASVALCYGVAGFWLLDERVVRNQFDPAGLDSSDYAQSDVGRRSAPHAAHALRGVVPRFALRAFGRGDRLRRFQRSFDRSSTATARCRANAPWRKRSSNGMGARRSIISSSGRTSLISSARRGVASSPTGVGANFAVALADPVGPPEEIAETIGEFRRFCEDQGWGVAFYQTLPDFLPVLSKPRFQEAEDRRRRDRGFDGLHARRPREEETRSRVKQLEKEGVRMKYYAAPIPDAC